MTRAPKKRSQKAGLPPGTLVHIGEKVVDSPEITIVNYTDEGCATTCVESVEDCADFREKPGVTWFNVYGVNQPETIEKMGRIFSLHPLLMEDIMNTDQRPKMEAYDDYLFVVLKTLYYNENEKEIVTDQISFVLGKNYVVSFQERRRGLFDPVRSRLGNGKGRIRKITADFLLYSLIDVIIDNYFVVLEKLGEIVDQLEVRLVASPRTEALQAIQRLKREMIFLKRSVWPLREVIGGMERGESPLIQDSTYLYLRDIYDHTVQAIDIIETYRDTLSGMLDIYLSSVSNRLNEVMKVLTIIATIFIPLTFIVGVYGMNFEFMPELKWRWGYPFVLILMLSVSLFMVHYFKKKKWF